MFKNHLKTAFRNLKKQRVYFSINILGLGIGLGSTFLLLLYTINEFTYDRNHPKADQTYRILMSDLEKNELKGGTPYPLAALIRENLPAVEKASQLFNRHIPFNLSDEVKSQEQDIVFTDKALFELFDIPVTSGLSVQDWDDPFQIYINDQMAKRYFPDTNPIGQVISIDENNQKTTLKIAGIFKSLPSNTHLKMDLIAPIALAAKIYKEQEFMGFKWHAFDSWERNAIQTYAQVQKDADIRNLTAQLKQISQPHLKNPGNVDYRLQSIRDIHLYSGDINNNDWEKGDLQQILLLLAIALLILFIAVFNFILLAMARSNTRLQEIGLRKVLGAQKQDIIRQTLAETICTAILSLPVALLFAETVLPFFNHQVEKNLVLFDWQNWPFILCVIGLTLLTGILSGSYSAFRYSGFQPHHILKIAHSSFSNRSLLKRILIGVQFIIFIALLICTVTISRQFHYIQHKHLGYDKEHLITIPLDSKQLVSQYPLLKNRLKTSPAIVNVSGASYTPPTENFIWAKFENTDKGIEYIFVDRGYFETMGIQMLEGNVFSDERVSDDNGVVLTASSIPYLELENPVGQDLFGQGPVIGIVEDFHIRSLHRSIRPVMFKMSRDNISAAVVRLQANMIPKALQDIRQIWQEINPDVPFTFQFVDEALNLAYHNDLRFSRLIQLFTMLAIVIASMGLFGLSLFLTEQKTKEIGTRKVLGASVSEIVFMLTKDFTRWVVVANLFAWPVAWLAMNKWLQNFAYRIDLTIWSFLLSGLLALLIALLTVSWQAIRAATANPVESLRNE
ncbi:MAG TPA: ABC transporter permease [bacterium]|nr:ABC transporter permease [bacterium]HPN45876.1 ABC transporter permease [bacterium]